MANIRIEDLVSTTPLTENQAARVRGGMFESTAFSVDGPLPHPDTIDSKVTPPSIIAILIG